MVTTADEDYMRKALAYAEIALQGGRIPIGAIFVDSSGNIIARGIKEGDRHHLFDHAEHNGCYEALWAKENGPKNLEGITVYSTLEPCIMCTSMLMTTRVKRIVYAMEDPYGGGAFILRNPGFLPARFTHERPVLDGNCLREESRSLLKTFFISKKDTNSSWSNSTNELVVACMEDD